MLAVPAADLEMMRRALANAERGWGQTAPNPMVGAVVVSGGHVVADGWHARYGEAHAEVMALRHAGDLARGATIYVTLEPCAHHGRTPPCTDAIVAAGIARVVVAARDPNPVAGGGMEILGREGIAVDSGILEGEARELNAAFFNAFHSDRPWVTLKLAVSADGAVADPSGGRRWITGEASRREVHRMRADVDAVAVGRGTVVADDPELTVRDVPAPRQQPTRVVFDSALSIPLDAKVVRTARDVPTIAVARDSNPQRRAALEAQGVHVIEAADAGAALRALRQLGIRSLLLEGGPVLAGAFLAADLVDRLALFTAPVEIGPGAPGAFAHAPPGFTAGLARFPVVRREAFGPDSLVVRALHEVPGS
ncbi:MAG TPA: bifunctional diaminohydroxyphosphoribosylaminopyrimidine deaminase/5-amino-6-(5-phosphoribosylamino)uracil reductase RibD [Gemmatimonadaceae bacterium]|nr:bifunctional diaminohydroxyphosphoribosylaminopyrimidine deaminase/5-amino-6-(5-phosphoribosylamino)uracil reductase RibD [Gemmatimonadaceae bacterium]